METSVKEKMIAVPLSLLNTVRAALRFYADDCNHETVTFAKHERENQLKRLQSDTTFRQVGSDGRGHEQFVEDGSRALSAFSELENFLFEEEENTEKRAPPKDIKMTVLKVERLYLEASMNKHRELFEYKDKLVELDGSWTSVRSGPAPSTTNAGMFDMSRVLLVIERVVSIE